MIIVIDMNLAPAWVEVFAAAGWEAHHWSTLGSFDAPDAEMLTFDIEVMWKETSFPAMACAASDKAWYAWLSPWLLGESESDKHLIPLGDPQKPRIVVGLRRCSPGFLVPDSSNIP